MKYYTIFASCNDIDDINGYIQEVFGGPFQIERNGNEYTLQPKGWFKRNTITLHVVSEDTDPDYFQNNLPGMMGLYQNIPFENEELQKLVLTQISVLNTMIAIQTEKEYNDSYQTLFIGLQSKVKGIGFLPDTTLIDRDGSVIVYPDGRSGPAVFRVFACTRKVRGEESVTSEGEQRKRKSIAYLQEKGVPFLETLPQLPALADLRFKTREEIAKRAISLLLVIQYACDVEQGNDLEESKQFVLQYLEKYGVEQELTDQERALIQGASPLKQDAINLVWQYEAYWVLIWSLGLVRSLDFPDRTCDCDYAIKAVSSCESFDDFISQTNERSSEEILDEADKIYRLHWACVNARIQGMQPASGLIESVVMERRRALFWLIGDRDESWDHIHMDT